MNRVLKVPGGTVVVAILLAWVYALIGAQPAWATTGPDPHTWERWEHVLAGTHDYANPYADVTLRVTYVGPGGRTLRTYGFWDGGDTFRIRCAFPVTEHGDGKRSAPIPPMRGCTGNVARWTPYLWWRRLAVRTRFSEG